MRAPGAARLTLALSADEFRRGTVWLEEQGRSRQIPEDKVYALNVCLNEALANVACHSGVDVAQAGVEVEFDCVTLAPCARATLLLRYGGMEFDPLLHEPTPPADSLDDALPGGGGIALMRAFADELQYARKPQGNELGFTVRWDLPPGTADPQPGASA